MSDPVHPAIDVALHLVERVLFSDQKDIATDPDHQPETDRQERCIEVPGLRYEDTGEPRRRNARQIGGGVLDARHPTRYAGWGEGLRQRPIVRRSKT